MFYFYLLVATRISTPRPIIYVYTAVDITVTYYLARLERK